jgi:N-acetylneuraminic acid mutarotase
LADLAKHRKSALERLGATVPWLALVALLMVVALIGAALQYSRPPTRIPRVEGRLDSTATLLRDGTILVVGGRPFPGSPTNIAERFDPQTGLWHAAGSTRHARTSHTASLLPDGSVAVVGGVEGSSWFRAQRGLTTVERYLPAENRWTTLAPLPQGVTDHSAVVLADGRLLIAGGRDREGVPFTRTAAAWAYDPTQDSWRALVPMPWPSESSVGLLLADGRALVFGSIEMGDFTQAPSWAVYNPATDLWQTGPVTGLVLVGSQRAARLPDGRLLIVDGEDCVIYDPQRATWHRAAPNSHLTSYGTLTTLADGRVLHAGGTIQAIYDPTTDQWQTSQRTISRAYHTATLLPDGRIVLLGGQSVEEVGHGHDAELIQP